MNFKDYIAQSKAGYDATGDFVRLARVDTSLPEPQTLAELQAYLTASGMPQQAIEGAAKVWENYRKAVKDACRADERAQA